MANREHDDVQDDGPECDPGCHQGSHTETCAWYDWRYPDG